MRCGDEQAVTDEVVAGSCAPNGIDTIVTADAAFDAARGIRRVDPLDGTALERLLGER